MSMDGNTSLQFYPLICNLTGIDSTVVPATSPLGMLAMSVGFVIVLFGLLFIMQVLIRLILTVISLGRFHG